MNFLLDEFPKGSLVLDASVIINLLGSGGASDILGALQVQCLVEKRTLEEITRHPIPGLYHEQELTKLQELGLIQVHRMSAEEYRIYLELVSGPSTDNLDDGESAAIAVASCQRLGIVLDERKARRIQCNRFPDLAVTSSLRLFISAGLRGDWPLTRVRDIVYAARNFSRMNIVKSEEFLLDYLVVD